MDGVFDGAAEAAEAGAEAVEHCGAFSGQQRSLRVNLAELTMMMMVMMMLKKVDDLWEGGVCGSEGDGEGRGARRAKWGCCVRLVKQKYNGVGASVRQQSKKNCGCRGLNTGLLNVNSRLDLIHRASVLYH